VRGLDLEQPAGALEHLLALFEGGVHKGGTRFFLSLMGIEVFNLPSTLDMMGILPFGARITILRKAKLLTSSGTTLFWGGIRMRLAMEV